MYSIYVSKNLIWSPNTANNGYVVLNPILTAEINQPWTLEFDIPVGAVGYNRIGRLISTIEVRDDNVTIFVGRCISIDRDWYGTKHFVCESEIAWLKDAVIRPYSFSKKPQDYAAWLTSTYNSQVSANRRITFVSTRSDSSSGGGTGNTIDTSGYPTLRYGSRGDYVTQLQTFLTDLGYGSGLNPNYFGQYGNNTVAAVTAFQQAQGLGPSGLGICGPNTWAAIQAAYGGSYTQAAQSYSNEEYRQFDEEITEVFAPAEAGVDTWDDFEKTSSFLETTYTRDASDNLSISIKCRNVLDTGTQSIEAGLNLLDFAESITAEDIYTVIVPTGKHDENTGYLTVASVNGGNDYIEADSAIISLFGRIVKTVNFSDIEDASELLLKGTEELNMNIEEALTVSINAVDMHLLDSTINRLAIGTYHYIVFDPYDDNLVFRYRCTKIDYDLMNPDRTVYTFGTEREGISNAVASNAKSAK